MRALAEFVMRGRLQAIGVCLIGASLPPIHWLCTTVVSLVVLRKGLSEGVFVLLWACLPLAIFFYLYGDLTPFIALFGTVCLAYILRVTASWEITLAAAVVVAALGSLIFQLTAADLIAQLVDRYLDFLVEVQMQSNKANELATAGILPTHQEASNILFGYIVMGFGFSVVAFLILARWWQSLLYNPGGFGKEFQSLRLSPTMGTVLVVSLLLCFGLGEHLRWGRILTLPLLLAGIGFVHWIVAEKELSRSWLYGFYLMMVLMIQLMTPIIAMVALIDSWVDLRKKLRSDREV